MNELQIAEQIKPLQIDISDFVQAAMVLVVEDENSYKAANHIREELKTRLAQVEAKEDEFTDPASKLLKKIRSVFKPVKDDIKAALLIVQTKTSDWYVYQKRIEAELQAKENAKAERKFAKNEQSGKSNPLPVPVAAHIELAQKKVEGVVMIDHWDAQVMDISKIPLYSADGIQLMVVNTTALNKIGNESKGKAVIPGVKWNYTPYPRSTR